MRWIVTGSGGQLGSCLVDRLGVEAPGTAVQPVAHADLDLADARALDAALEAWELGPDVVVANAAAFTAVDRCESEGAQAHRVNAAAPARIAAACAHAGARLVHVSTDYVFSGEPPGGVRRPWREDDPVGPRSAYGRTKLAGEQAVLEACPDALVVRTSWVFGPGRNFVGAILRQAALRRSGEARGPLRVVDDQHGAPTYAADLASGLLALVRADASGLLHLCNEGAISWWDFARAILDESGHGDLRIERARTESLDLPAPRPRYSVLDCSRAAALGVKLRPWREALRAYLGTLEAAPARPAAGHG